MSKVLSVIQQIRLVLTDLSDRTVTCYHALHAIVSPAPPLAKNFPLVYLQRLRRGGGSHGDFGSRCDRGDLARRTRSDGMSGEDEGNGSCAAAVVAGSASATVQNKFERVIDRKRRRCQYR